MLASDSGYALVLQVINGSNLVVPSHRMPSGFCVSISTAYGQWKTAMKTVMADYSVHWNESLVIQGRPLMFPRWLMPIFPSTLKVVHLEIRALFEAAMLGRGELVGRVETTLEELLVHGKQFEIQLPAKNRCPSLLLKAQRLKPREIVGRGTIKPSEVDLTTDAAHEAYAVYRKSNHRNHLDGAIKSFEAVLDRCPDDHPHRGAALSNLAHVILHGFIKGVQTDIDHAISLFRSALALCPYGHSDHLLSIHNLCKAHHQRYSHFQDHGDLREVVKLYLKLLPICLEGSYLQHCVIEECNALPREAFDESISLRRMILDLCPHGHRQRARSLNRLAGDLYARFEQSGNFDDIDKAVDLSREALAVSGEGERSFFLSVLAYTLKLRSHDRRYPDDINECISLNRAALSLRPLGHPARQRSLNNLAKALTARYDQYHNFTDLEEAMDLNRATHDPSSGNSVTPPSQRGEEYIDLGHGQLSCTPEPEPEEGQRQSPLELTQSDPPDTPRTRNVVIFGESGSGKSSIINAIAQDQRAQTSSSAAGCTFRYEKHKVNFSGETFILFDTVGLDEGTAGTVPAAEAEENLKSLLRELMNPKSEGISLLVYCVRSVRVSRALLRNYNLFYSAICRKKVPIVVVVTGLENQEPTMDSWWHANWKEFKKCGMHFEDHACVTSLRNHPDIPDVYTQRITESGEVLRSLILNNCSEWTADNSYFKLFFADVRNMISDRLNTARSSPRTLVVCDPSQEVVKIAQGFYGVLETCSMRINGVKYQIHNVSEPKLPIPTSSVEADLLIYHVRADDENAARERFDTFCAAYHGNTVPIIVVVIGVDSSKAAQEWVERHLMQDGAGRPFATFTPAGDIRDRNAEQGLLELIERSCLVRSEARGEGFPKTIVNFLGTGRWLGWSASSR